MSDFKPVLGIDRVGMTPERLEAMGRKHVLPTECPNGNTGLCAECEVAE